MIAAQDPTVSRTVTNVTVERPVDVDLVAAARAQVQKLVELERDWSIRRRRLAAELAELERTSGEQVLTAALEADGEPMARNLAGQVSAMRAELETTDRTIEAARRRREQAIPAVFAAEAKQLRGQAAALVADADAREPKTRELLAAIEEWEGCSYAPAPPNRSGQHVGGPAIGGSPEVVWVPTPKTLALRQQAAMLERQAQQAELRTPDRSGQVTGRDLKALEEAIFADPLRLGPALAAIETWMEAARAAETARHSEMERRSGQVVARAIIDFKPAWSDGVLRADQSSPACSFRAERR
ncbi:MAG: hypothetical protein ABSC46_13055 [Candidatus Limnocylindrales bacterium]|jgi:hypothetical protein